MKIILDLIKFKNSNFQKSKSIELILVIYVVLYLALFILSSFPELNHLLGLYPFIAMILALFFNRLFQLKTKVYKITTIILLILLITSSVASYEFLFTLQPIEDVSEIVDFLEEKNISYLYTTFFIKWRLIMESDEHIIASCDGLCPCVHRYPLYEEIVSKQTKTPIILRDGSLLNDKLKDYLYEHKIIFNTLSIDNKSIYYHFSEEIVPSDFVSNCKFLDGFPPK